MLSCNCHINFKSSTPTSVWLRKVIIEQIFWKHYLPKFYVIWKFWGFFFNTDTNGDYLTVVRLTHLSLLFPCLVKFNKVGGIQVSLTTSFKSHSTCFFPFSTANFCKLTNMMQVVLDSSKFRSKSFLNSICLLTPLKELALLNLFS